MSVVDETVIRLSVKKLLLLICGLFVVVVLGTWFFSLDAETIHAFRRLNSPAFVHGFGVFLVLLAGLSGFYLIRRLFGDRRGLVFNNVGIVAYTNRVTAGLIPWHDIAGAEIVKLRTQTLLAIKLKEPTKFLERQTPLKRALLFATFRSCGSPLVLSTNLLSAKPSELFARFSHYLQKYGNA